MTPHTLSAADALALMPRVQEATAEPTPAPLVVRSLAELLDNPALLAPPEAVAAPFIFAGRVTLLSGREKSGKTTLAANAAAAITTGAAFLGNPVASGPVLWISLDEALGDTVRRFAALGADPHLLHLVTDVPSPARLHATLAAMAYRLVVIDTLNELALGIPLKDSDRILPILRPIVEVIRASSAGCVIIGHAGKSSGVYLGSVTIGGAVDAALTLKRVGDGKAPPADPGIEEESEEPPDDGRRVLTGVTRWGGKFRERLQYDNGRYSIGSAPIPLAVRILRELAGDAAGISASDLADLLGKRKQDTLDALRDLANRGLVDGSGTRGPRRITDSGRNYLREWENGAEPGGNRGGTGAEPHGNYPRAHGSRTDNPSIQIRELSGAGVLDVAI